MSDAEFAVTEPVPPEPAWRQGKGGRPAEHCRRDIVDAVRYLIKEGIQWRAMPTDFPHSSTVYDCLVGWQATGATTVMHGELHRQCRIAAGRKPEPTAAVIDSQSVKAAETVARASRGFDAGKKTTAASGTTPSTPWACYWWLSSPPHLSRTATAFVVLRRRWVVERTFSWITRSRRTVRDYERLEEHHAAMVYWSMIIIMTRRLARQRHGTSHGPPATQQALLQAA
jgi:transposase